MKLDRKAFGSLGEKIAKKYLLRNQYKILEEDIEFWGGQIDLIANKEKIIHFVEVKTRSDDVYVSVDEVLSYHQLQTLKKSAEKYLYSRKIYNVNWQIDLLWIFIKHGQVREIELFEDITFN